MKVYAFQASEAVLYLRDGKIVLIAEIGEADDIESGIEQVCGAELVLINDKAAQKQVEQDIDVYDLTEATEVVVAERIMKWINEHNL